MSEIRPCTTDIVIDAESLTFNTFAGARLCWIASLEAFVTGGRFLIRAQRSLSAEENEALQFLEILADDIIHHWPESPYVFMSLKPTGKLPPGALSGKVLPMVIFDDRPLDEQGNLTISSYRENGYLPSALLNFLSLVTWQRAMSFDVFTPAQIRSLYQSGQFSGEPTLFSSRELLKLNAAHIRRTPPRELMVHLRPFLAGTFSDAEERSEGWAAWATQLLQTRISTLTEAASTGAFLFSVDEIAPTDDARQALFCTYAPRVLERFIQRLNTSIHFNGSENRKLLKDLKKEMTAEGKIWDSDFDHLLEAVLTNQISGYPLTDVMTLLGKDTCLDRAGKALAESLQVRH